MSREISIKVGPTSVGGTWKSEAKAPLILNPCQHYLETKTEGWWKWKKEWKRVYHGGADGRCSVSMQCDKDRK